MIDLNKRIEKAIDYSGLKQIEIAKNLNLAANELSNIVRGVVKNPKLKVLVELARVCRVDLRWLITGDGEMIKQEPVRYGPEDLVMVPILGRIPAGSPSWAEEVHDGSVPVLKKDVSKDAFALKVMGESMMPELEDGNIVVVEPTQADRLRDGEIVAVRIHTETFIKRFHKNNEESVVLTSQNPNYRPMIKSLYEIGFLGRIVMKIKKYKEG